MATSTLPLAEESALFDYLQGLITGKAPNPKYTGVEVQRPELIKELSGDALQSIITEYLRGQGNLLGALSQPRQAGLYNSNTRTLVSNDILTSAARKAALANTAIQESNAKITNDYVRNLLASQPKYIDTSNQRKSAAGGLAISGLEKLLGLSQSKGGKSILDAASKGLKGLFSGGSESEMSDEEFDRLLRGSSAQQNFSPAAGAFPVAAALNDLMGMSTPMGNSFVPEFSLLEQFSAPVNYMQFAGEGDTGYEYIDSSTFLPDFGGGSSGGGSEGSFFGDGQVGDLVGDLVGGLLGSIIGGGGSGGGSGGGGGSGDFVVLW